MKTSTHVIFIKKHLNEVFDSNKHNYVGEKNCWKIMLQAFVPKFISHVSQKTRWNQRKISPKIILNVLEKIHFLA
jgi:hypothetical protein